MGSGTTGWVGWRSALALSLLVLPALAAAGTAPGSAQTAARRPNIVLIVTDDQDVRSVDHMPNVVAELRGRGLEFSNFFASLPSCCPSRASILRGQYVHNHGVKRSSGDLGGYDVFYEAGHERSTVATWLQDCGYRTGLFGKYLNGYGDLEQRPGERHVPPGWDEWHAGVPLDYEKYDLNENGAIVRYDVLGRAGPRDDRPEHYSTDVLRRKAVRFVEEADADGRPFFLYLAPRAPHGPFTPPTRYENLHPKATAPRPPSFNEDISDKPEWIANLDPIGPQAEAAIDERYRLRRRTLRAVDDAVGVLVDALRRTGEIDDTYLFFTSDNGFHQGEHNTPADKGTSYDEAIKVPLLVRGPGVPVGRTVTDLASVIDLAPTVADLTGAAVPGFVDGRSLVPRLREATPLGRQALLVEHYRGNADGQPSATEAADDREPEHARIPTFGVLRSAAYHYVEHHETVAIDSPIRDRELYDVAADPFQLTNVAKEPAYAAVLAEHAERLGRLWRCERADCRAIEDEPFTAQRTLVRSRAAAAREAEATADRRERGPAADEPTAGERRSQDAIRNEARPRNGGSTPIPAPTSAPPASRRS